MSHSNTDKSYLEGSYRHINEQVKSVLHSIKRKRLGNPSTNSPSSNELLEDPQELPEGGGNSEILQWMESTIIQTSNQKDKVMEQQKEGGGQGRSPSSFYQQASSQSTPQERKKKWKNPYSPSSRIPRIHKYAMENVINMARTFMEFKDKKEQRMRQPSFPKK
ncbi:hypothetical protein O181_039097 [Austropuccinia psidii MF-1]|uniref:Uncharacterized protein n=1 Tax=Austropuccinia psidii MF-1 TaxID=1389203 RepID=A0A9Q3DG31_9BASI|nr:hypothetical protein [Austropuccinia psidii MF-1]